MDYEGMIAETVRFAGAGGEYVEGYLARPLLGGPRPSVVVLHHLPGWDDAVKEVTRKFAHHGYVALAPHLFCRVGGGGLRPDDAAAAVRASGGVPIETVLGDVEGAFAFLRSQPYATDKVGVIGFCSGGRQSFIIGCRLDVDAAVDCYGGWVVSDPEELADKHPGEAHGTVPIDLAPDLSCPLLGLFGLEDENPSPEHVAVMEERLTKYGKDFEFHSYPGTGHGFFMPDRRSYRVDSANDGWRRVLTFFAAHLGGAPAGQ